VFEGEGYDTPTDQRYCMNSISMRLQPAAQPARVAGGGGAEETASSGGSF
jgi:peptide methionine sulfoxide reductase MsrB